MKISHSIRCSRGVLFSQLKASRLQNIRKGSTVAYSICFYCLKGACKDEVNDSERCGWMAKLRDRKHLIKNH